jgi:SAM-dependent methyltransferase
VGGPAPGERSQAGGLVARSHCPVCGEFGNPFLSLPYDTDPIAGYLASFYNGALDATALTGQHYELIDCASCGLVYQAHIPDAALLDHLYGHAALHDLEKVKAARGLSVRRSYANDIEQCIKYFGGDPAAVEVLDFGSGPGLWLGMAAAYGCRTAGSEMSGVGLRPLIDAGHEAFTPENLPAERFHFVNTEQVVEHLTDPRGTLDRLARALRPGGILRINVPNGTGIRSRLEDGDWSAPKGSPMSLNPVAPLEHLNCFDHGSLQRLGEIVGLRPFHYPVRQYLDPMERTRFTASAVLHLFRRPRGTLQLFKKQ